MSKPMGRPGGRGPMSVNLDKAKDAKGTLKRVLNYLKSSKKLLEIYHCIFFEKMVE